MFQGRSSSSPAGECLPSRTGIADGAGEFALAGNTPQLRVEPGGQGVELGRCLALAHGRPPLRREPGDAALDIEQHADPLERLFGDRGVGRSVHVEELAARMRPATDLRDAGRSNACHGIKFAKSGIAVGMQEPAEGSQMRTSRLACHRQRHVRRGEERNQDENENQGEDRD